MYPIVLDLICFFGGLNHNWRVFGGVLEVFWEVFGGGLTGFTLIILYYIIDYIVV